MNSVATYFEFCKEIFLEPVKFFREYAPNFSLETALLIGLLSIWIGKIIAFFWSLLAKVFFNAIFGSFSRNLLIADSIFSWDSQSDIQTIILQSGAVLLQPFFGILRLALAALVLWMFAKFFINKSYAEHNNVTYKNSLKIAALAAVSSWLLVVPFLGGFFAYIAALVFLVIGVRETYMITSKRALLIVFTPQILFVAFMFFLFFIIVLLAIAGISSGLLKADDVSDGFESLMKVFRN